MKGTTCWALSSMISDMIPLDVVSHFHFTNLVQRGGDFGPTARMAILEGLVKDGPSVANVSSGESRPRIGIFVEKGDCGLQAGRKSLATAYFPEKGSLAHSVLRELKLSF